MRLGKFRMKGDMCMKNEIIEVGIEGCDGYYPVGHFMVCGSIEAESIFTGFHHPKVTNVDGRYISAYHHEEAVAEALKKHFKNNGCKELKVKNYTVGD